MENFNLEHWWKAATGAGVLVAGSAAAIGHNSLLLVGLGFLCFGIGEWINRPKRSEIYMGSGMKGIATSHPWSPKFIGIALDVIGIGCFLLGLVRIVLA